MCKYSYVLMHIVQILTKPAYFTLHMVEYIQLKRREKKRGIIEKIFIILNILTQ